MTEAEWLNSTDPGPMLDYLGRNAEARKLRLFACACCRRIWHLLDDERSKRAVEIAERYADGSAPFEALHEAWDGARTAVFLPADTARGAAQNAARRSRAVRTAAARAAVGSVAAGAVAASHSAAARATATQARQAQGGEKALAEATERQAQATLLRCIFGDPFKPVPAVGPEVLAWNGGAVVKLAEAIYEDRDFDRLGVLADALEEAGCTDAELLAHLRGPGPHVLGCWALDAAAGRL